MKKMLLSALLACTIMPAFSQGQPLAQKLPFSENFGSDTFTVMPDGLAIRNGLNGSAVNSFFLAGNSKATGNANPDGTNSLQTNGGIYGYAQNNNACLYLQQSGNVTNGVNQVVLAFENDTANYLSLEYDLITLAPSGPGNRDFNLALQLKEEATGNWMDIPGSTVIVPATASVNTILPQKLLLTGLLPGKNYQVRWINWRNGTGLSSGIGIDNINVKSVSALHYYYSGSGQLDQLSSWNSDPSGSGRNSPASFSADYTFYHLRNADTIVHYVNWNIASSSRLLIENTLVMASGAVSGGGIDIADKGTLILQNSDTAALGYLHPASTIQFSRGKSTGLTGFHSYGHLVLSDSIQDAPELTGLYLAGNLVLAAHQDLAHYDLQLTGNQAQQIIGNGKKIVIHNFSDTAKGRGHVTLSSTGGATRLIATNDFLLRHNDSLSHKFSDEGNILSCGNNLNLDGSPDAYDLRGTMIMTASPGGSPRLQNNEKDQQAIVPALHHLVFAPENRLNNFDFQPSSGKDTIRIKGDLRFQPNTAGSMTGKFNLFENTIQLGGHLEFNRTSDNLNAHNSNIEFNGNSKQLYTCNPAIKDGLHLNRTLITNTKDTVHFISPLQVKGNAEFIVDTNAVLDLEDVQLKQYDSGIAMFHIRGTCCLKNTSGFSGTNGTSIHQNNTQIILAPGSTIVYNGPTQKITTSQPYANLSLSGGGYKTLSGELFVTGNISISDSATLAGGGKTITVSGDWLVNSTGLNNGYTGGTNHQSRVILNGNGNRVFRHENGGDFRNLAFTGNATYKIFNDLRISVDTLEISNATVDMDTHSLSGSASLYMTSGTLMLKELNTVLPGLTGSYLLTGGAIEFNGAGLQTLRGAKGYHDLIFSGSGTKRLSYAVPYINGTVLINGSNTIDAENNTFGGDSTNLVMSDGRLILSGTSHNPYPNMEGSYTLSGGVIEFNGSGLTAQTIRPISPSSFSAIEITGNNVSNGRGNIPLGANAYFTIKPDAVFRISADQITGTNGSTIHVKNKGTLICNDVEGLWGGGNTSVAASIASIILDTGASIHYSRTGTQRISAGTYPHLTINGSGLKTLSGDIQVKGNLLVENATLDASINNFSISLQGDWNKINALFNPRKGKVLLEGNRLQNLKGNTNFYTLQLNNPSGAAIGTGINDSVSVLNTFIHTDGLLHTNDKLTLTASSYMQYGQVDGTGSGDIKGIIHAQYYASAMRGIQGEWIQLGSPLKNVTIAQLEDDLYVRNQGNNALLYNAYMWNESLAGTGHTLTGSAWRPAYSNSNISDTAVALFVFRKGTVPGKNTSDSLLIDVSGTYHKGSKTYANLTHTGTVTDSSGWHLLANPWPSGYNHQGAVIANLNANQISIYEKGQLLTHNGSVGTNGWNGVVPPFHGMYVNVTMNNSSITLNNAKRTTSTRDNHFDKTNTVQNLIRIRVENSGKTDEALIYTDDKAENEKDVFDALKKYNDEGFPNIYTLAGDRKSPIQVRKDFGKETRIPLNFYNAASGEHLLYINTENMDPGYRITLQDLFTGENKLFSTQEDFYAFDHDPARPENRFLLIIAMDPMQVRIKNETTGSPVVISVTGTSIIMDSKQELNYCLFDMQGRDIIRGSLTAGENKQIDTRSLSPGIYTLHVYGNQFSNSRKIIIP